MAGRGERPLFRRRGGHCADHQWIGPRFGGRSGKRMACFGFPSRWRVVRPDANDPQMSDGSDMLTPQSYLWMLPERGSRWLYRGAFLSTVPAGGRRENREASKGALGPERRRFRLKFMSIYSVTCRCKRISVSG